MRISVTPRSKPQTHGKRCHSWIVELASPMRKRSTHAVDPPIMVDASPEAPSLATVGGSPSIFAEAAGTIPTPAATAKASKTKKRPMETTPPAVGIAVSENLLGHIETLADTADMPETAQKEREASTAEKGKPKGSSNRRRYPRKTNLDMSTLQSVFE